VVELYNTSLKLSARKRSSSYRGETRTSRFTSSSPAGSCFDASQLLEKLKNRVVCVSG